MKINKEIYITWFQDIFHAMFLLLSTKVKALNLLDMNTHQNLVRDVYVGFQAICNTCIIELNFYNSGLMFQHYLENAAREWNFLTRSLNMTANLVIFILVTLAIIFNVAVFYFETTFSLNTRWPAFH